MSKRKIFFATLIPLLILVGVVAFNLWAGEQILPGAAPVASATADPVEVAPGAEVSFDGSESYDKDIKATWEEKNGKKYNYQEVEIDGVVTNWAWDFGDGGTGEGATTTHTYEQGQEEPYEVTLTITADHDESADTTIEVKVGPGIVLTAEPQSIISGNETTLTATAVDNNGDTDTNFNGTIEFSVDHADRLELSTTSAQAESGVATITGTGQAVGEVRVKAEVPNSDLIPGQVDVKVFSLEILAPPNEDDVFLKGQELKFIGKVLPETISDNDVTWSWSFSSGSGDPATGNTKEFITTLTSEGTVKVKLEATYGGTTTFKERSIEALVPEVIKISFNNDHPLKKYGGQDIVDPVWDSASGTNEPACYTKGAQATAELEITASSSLTSLTSVQVQGTGQENFVPEGAEFHNWTWSAGELQLNSSDLYSSVNFYDALEITWQYRVAKLTGGWGEWVTMNNSSHRIYTIYANPLEDPLYDFALEKATSSDYAENESQISSIADGINTGIDDDISYDPSYEFSDHILELYSDGEGQCSHHADLLRYLAHSVGINGSVVYIWGGCSSTYRDHYIYRGWWGPTFRVLKAAHDDADTNPHFNFHAVTLIGGEYYDPSYGETGLIDLDETAPAHTIGGVNYPAATRRTGSSLPSSYHTVNWTCPH